MRKNEFVVVKLNFAKKVVDKDKTVCYYIKVAKNEIYGGKNYVHFYGKTC